QRTPLQPLAEAFFRLTLTRNQLADADLRLAVQAATAGGGRGRHLPVVRVTPVPQPAAGASATGFRAAFRTVEPGGVPASQLPAPYAFGAGEQQAAFPQLQEQVPGSLEALQLPGQDVRCRCGGKRGLF